MVDKVEVSSIKIDTGYAGLKEYPVFSRPDGKNAQCAIILGKNGSGKSTIARALEDGYNVEFFDKNEGFLGRDCSNVHVFNESYVVKNFRIYEEESLEPIVLLGAPAQGIRKIEYLRRRISEIEERKIHLKTQLLIDIFGGKPSIGNQPLCDFTIMDYVSACIDNELDGLVNGDYAIHVLLDRLGEENNFNSSLYIRWIALAYRSIHGEILEDIDGGKGWSALSEEQVLKELEKSNFELIELLKKYEKASVSEILEGANELDRKRRFFNFLIMVYLCKCCPYIYAKILDGVASKYADEIYRKNMELSDLGKVLELEIEKLENKKKEESHGKINGYMNKLLQGVYGERKICVESDGCFGYKVKSGSVFIQPSKLSTGEQNILALCYFFAKVSEGDGYFDRNQIIVLDDPLSSFDDGNKYGVTTLLGYLCQSILDKGSKTKLIIMTHDSSFALNMSKMVKSIDSNKLSCGELQKDSSEPLKETKFEDIDRYAGVLRSMYDFALQEEKSLTAPPPNDVRRVWEAFLTFELGETSIANMDSLKKLSGYFSKNQKIERFMRVFIPQLFINNDSHAKSQVMNGNLYLTPTLDGKPYEDFVKNIVCFMHIVAPRHIAWRMKKIQGENPYDSVAKLDNLVREVLDDPKIVAATSSWQGNQGLRRARHRGGRVPLGVRRQIAGR